MSLDNLRLYKRENQHLLFQLYLVISNISLFIMEGISYNSNNYILIITNHNNNGREVNGEY
jgi:hypothetical protein